MKKWFFSLALIIGIISLTACSDNSDVVVETKAGNITQNQFYAEMKKQSGPQVLTNMIYYEILPEKYEIDKDEFDKQYEAFKANFGENYLAQIEQVGLTDDDVKRLIELELLFAEVEKVAMKNIKVTDEEIKEYYEIKYPQIHARHILVEDEKEANSIKAKLDNGEDFEELAKEHSTDPGSKQAGGDLKWFGPGEMVKEFSDVAFSLEKDEISDPVESQHGYHIIQVLDKREKPALKDVEKELKKEIREAKAKNDQSYLTEQLKKEMDEADVKIKDKDLKKLMDTDK